MQGTDTAEQRHQVTLWHTSLLDTSWSCVSGAPNLTHTRRKQQEG